MSPYQPMLATTGPTGQRANWPGLLAIQSSYQPTTKWNTPRVVAYFVRLIAKRRTKARLMSTDTSTPPFVWETPSPLSTRRENCIVNAGKWMLWADIASEYPAFALAMRTKRARQASNVVHAAPRKKRRQMTKINRANYDTPVFCFSLFVCFVYPFALTVLASLDSPTRASSRRKGCMASIP